jgi:hypothetical protein
MVVSLKLMRLAT